MRKSSFELLFVMAITVILALVLIFKYINLATRANTAATTAIARALSSANTNNYATRTLNTTLGSPVANCTDLDSLLEGGLPAGYTITPQAVTIATTTTCTLTGPGAITSTFTATGIK